MFEYFLNNIYYFVLIYMLISFLTCLFLIKNNNIVEKPSEIIVGFFVLGIVTIPSLIIVLTIHSLGLLVGYKTQLIKALFLKN